MTIIKIIIPRLLFISFFLIPILAIGQNVNQELLNKLESYLFPKSEIETIVYNICHGPEDSVELTQRLTRPKIREAEIIIDSLKLDEINESIRRNLYKLIHRYDNTYYNEWSIPFTNPTSKHKYAFHRICISLNKGEKEYLFLYKLEELKYYLENKDLDSTKLSNKFISDLKLIINRSNRFQNFYTLKSLERLGLTPTFILLPFFYKKKNILKEAIFNEISIYQPIDPEKEVVFLDNLLGLAVLYDKTNEDILITKWEELKEMELLNRLFISKLVQLDSEPIKKSLVTYLINSASSENFIYTASRIINSGQTFYVSKAEFKSIKNRNDELDSKYSLRLKKSLPNSFKIIQ